MKKVKILVLLTAMASALFLTGCNHDGDTESGCTITGKALYSNVDDNSGITICLEKSDGFRTITVLRAAEAADSEDAIYSTETDSEGNYTFENLDEGLYTIYAISKDSSEKAVKANVSARASEITKIEDLILTATGSISGKILLDNTETDNFGVTVFIPGTSYSGITAEDGSFTISDVPVGSYGLAIQKGYYTYLWKSADVAVTFGAANDVGSLTTVTTEETLLKYSDGADGKDGSDGKDGEDGADGVDGKNGANGKDGNSINWLGSYASASSIKNPELYDAYFNTSDGCSYIYDGTKWTYLVQNAESTETADERNVYCNATDRGIMFEVYIPSFSGEEKSTVTFTIKEKESGVIMNKSVSNYGGQGVDVYYPFVTAGKEYTFVVSAIYNSYVIYTTEVTVTATGGLGEYKIENTDKYTVELTSDKVARLTGTPEFTDNDKVNLIDRATYYYVSRKMDEDTYWYVYNQTSWLSSSNGTLSLQDYSDGCGNKWRSFDVIDAMISGRKYKLYSVTCIKVAGYDENDSIFFEMNDWKTTYGDWGGEIVKVPIVIYTDGFKNIPGTETVIEYDGENVACNYVIADYGTYYYEPTELPEYIDAEESTFKYWADESCNSMSFPYWVLPDLSDSSREITIDGVTYPTFIEMYPTVEAKFNVTLYDKEENLGNYIVTEEVCANSYDNFKMDKTPEKEDCVLLGYYFDSDFNTSTFDEKVTKNNTILYTRWLEVETLYTATEDNIDSVTLDASKFENLATNDELYVDVYCLYDGYSWNLQTLYYDYLSDANTTGHSVSFGENNATQTGKSETLAIALKDSTLIENIKENGLKLYFNNTFYSVCYIKAVKYFNNHNN